MKIHDAESADQFKREVVDQLVGKLVDERMSKNAPPKPARKPKPAKPSAKTARLFKPKPAQPVNPLDPLEAVSASWAARGMTVGTTRGDFSDDVPRVDLRQSGNRDDTERIAAAIRANTIERRRRVIEELERSRPERERVESEKIRQEARAAEFWERGW